jgi:hypothetical protein
MRCKKHIAHTAKKMKAGVIGHLISIGLASGRRQLRAKSV